MDTSLSLNDIYRMLSGLSSDNKRWLAAKLIADTERSRQDGKKLLRFPHLPIDRPISKEVTDMVLGGLPESFDVERELEKMWEDRAK